MMKVSIIPMFGIVLSITAFAIQNIKFFELLSNQFAIICTLFIIMEYLLLKKIGFYNLHSIKTYPVLTYQV